MTIENNKDNEEDGINDDDNNNNIILLQHKHIQGSSMILLNLRHDIVIFCYDHVSCILFL